MENPNPNQNKQIQEEYQKQKVVNSIWFRYIITFSACFIVTFVFAAISGIFSSWEAVQAKMQWNIVDELTKNMFILTNATFFTGALALAFGLLVLASNGGMFEMFVYGMRRFFSLFQRDINKIRFKTFYDYHMYKSGQPKTPLLHLVIAGIFFLALSGIFLAIYMQNMPASA